MPLGVALLLPTAARFDGAIWVKTLIWWFGVCVCESHIGNPSGRRVAPQFTTGAAKPLTQWLLMADLGARGEGGEEVYVVGVGACHSHGAQSAADRSGLTNQVNTSSVRTLNSFDCLYPNRQACTGLACAGAQAGCSWL